MWAGSYDNNGKYDPHDDFIEIQNLTELPVNVSGWLVEFEGNATKTVIFPDSEDYTVYPDQFFVLARSCAGAWSYLCQPGNETLGAVNEELSIPDNNFVLTLKSTDKWLIEPVGIIGSLPLGGSEDGQTTRSMEREEDFFSSDGVSVSSWYTYNSAITGSNVASNYNQRTFASPGQSCQSEY